MIIEEARKISEIISKINPSADKQLCEKCFILGVMYMFDICKNRFPNIPQNEVIKILNKIDKELDEHVKNSINNFLKRN